MLRLLRQVGQYLNSCSYTNFDIICLKIGNILASFTYAEAPTPGWTIFKQLFLHWKKKYIYNKKLRYGHDLLYICYSESVKPVIPRNL